MKKQDIAFSKFVVEIRGKAEREKASYDVCKAEYRENKRDNLQNFWKEKAKAKF